MGGVRWRCEGGRRGWGRAWRGRDALAPPPLAAAGPHHACWPASDGVDGEIIRVATCQQARRRISDPCPGRGGGPRLGPCGGAHATPPSLSLFLTLTGTAPPPRPPQRPRRSTAAQRLGSLGWVGGRGSGGVGVRGGQRGGRTREWGREESGRLLVSLSMLSKPRAGWCLFCTSPCTRGRGSLSLSLPLSHSPLSTTKKKNTGKKATQKKGRVGTRVRGAAQGAGHSSRSRAGPRGGFCVCSVFFFCTNQQSGGWGGWNQKGRRRGEGVVAAHPAAWVFCSGRVGRGGGGVERVEAARPPPPPPATPNTDPAHRARHPSPHPPHPPTGSHRVRVWAGRGREGGGVARQK